jgi:FkbM family methyltransferase
MYVRSLTIRALRAITAPLPRVKGFGAVIAWIVKPLRHWDEDVKVKVFGNCMLLNSSDYLSKIVLFTPNYFDRRERKFIKSIVREGDLIVDVGANIGIYTLLFGALVGPMGRVLSIEAERDNARRLRHNIALNDMPWITVHEVGVSDKFERLPLSIDEDGNAGAHSFLMAGDPAKGQHINCKPLSVLLDPGRRARLIKLDIEGFEYRVLKQFIADIKDSGRPDYIMLEDVPSLREGDAVELLVNAGYRVLDRINFNVILEKKCHTP